MLAYTYVERGKFALLEKPRPVLLDGRDAIVRVTLASICTSDLHIKHGSVPRAVPGVTVGHEMVGVVEAVGPDVRKVRPGDRVTVNVETFCGECFFCKNGWVNNCTDPNGGWALGCRIDGGQAEYVRVPYADCGLDRIPDGVSDVQALLVGDLLATGYWAADISEVRPGDTALIIGVALVLYGIGRTIAAKAYTKGIWPAGIGVVLAVCALLLTAGWNDTAYYPSTADLQSSLTIANSCSSEFTLRTMAIVSIFIPFVLAYIFYAWRSIDKKKIDKNEIANEEAY